MKKEIQVKKGQLLAPFGTWLDTVPLGVYQATRDFVFKYDYDDGWANGYELSEKAGKTIQHYIDMGCLIGANTVEIHMFDC